MEEPIKAELFLVLQEDQEEAMRELTEAGRAAVTFPHHSGDYCAIAVATGEPKKKAKKSANPFQQES